ncbi:MAG: hypothetical protein ACK56I_25850, partial [bacterium]
MRLRNARLKVPPRAQHNQRHRRDRVRDHAHTRVDHGMLTKPLGADRRALGLVLLRVGRADQRHLRGAAGEPVLRLAGRAG